MEQDRGEQDELAALADELLEQASRMRRQWTELAEAVGLEGAETAPVPDARRADDIERMRLVALDMVLSGATRKEVAEHLRRTFDGDVDAVVEDVFAEYGE